MNRKTIYAALRRALSGKAFLAGIVGVFLLLLGCSIQDIVLAARMEGLLEEGFHYAVIQNALSSDGMTMALPILAVVPYAVSVVDDVRSGFIKEYLPRATRNGYLMGKIAACLLSGGLVFVCGILAACIVAALVFTPMESAAGVSAEVSSSIGELFLKGLLFFCSGAFWSMTGMVAAVWTGSKYTAYASPFVIYYVLIILHERYLGSMHVLYPKEWTAPSEYWMYGEMGVILFMTELALMAALCFWLAAKKYLF